MRAVLGCIDRDARETLVRAFHDQLYAPASAAEQRVSALGYLGRLLDELAQRPDALPYVERQVYARRRQPEAPDAPSARELCKRYGSWQGACIAAWGLLADGRNRFGIRPPGTKPGLRKPPPYTVEEAIASVIACERALGHIPSSFEYHMWRTARVRRARRLGQEIRLVHYKRIINLLAPERTHRDGWKIVIQKVYGMSRQP
jgi:hypothetical protein